MKLLTSFIHDTIKKPTAVTVGKFDGIHRGHACLASQIIEQRSNGFLAVMVTFDTSPRIALGQSRDANLLTNEEKHFLLEQRGLDYLVECPFQREIASMEPEAFIRQLTERFSMKYMAVGSDFHFGHKGRGDVVLLKKLAAEYGFRLVVKEKLKEDHRDISSTYIREEMRRGNIEKVNHLLGHPFFVCGTVVHGNHLGNCLGFPTINLIPPADKMLPLFGVYATTVQIDGNRYQGMTNVGIKPTIEGKRMPGVETNIFDFSGDLYGKRAVIFFHKYIRPEQKFAATDALSRQMESDYRAVRNYFNDFVS